MRLSDHVGDTPLLKITDYVYGKAEFLNPTGSIKDRPAVYILNKAEKEKRIKEGDTLVEASSGNMGISFAWLCAERGYKCKIIMPSNMSEERKRTLRYYGAELIEVSEGDFDGAIQMRNDMVKEFGYFSPMQFENPDNIECHYDTTATEIAYTTQDIGISAFIAGSGTGGTIMGVGRKLKMYNPDMKSIVVEPSESPVMSGGEPGLHGIQGIGDGSKFLVDMDKVDGVVTVSTEEASERALRLSKELGIFVGISAGANVLASERWVEENKPKRPVITILCDRGDRYFSCYE